MYARIVVVVGLSLAICACSGKDKATTKATSDVVWVPVTALTGSDGAREFLLRAGDDVALFDLGTKKVVWKTPLGAKDWTYSSDHLLPSATGKRVFLPLLDERVAVLDEVTGELLSMVKPSKKPYRIYVAPGARLVVEYEDGLELFDADSGKSLFTLDSYVVTSAVINQLLVAITDKELVAVDAGSGIERWRAPFRSAASPTIEADDGGISISSNDRLPLLHARFDDKNGEIADQRQVEGPGRVFLRDAGTAYLFDDKSKELSRYDDAVMVWKASTSEWPLSAFEQGNGVIVGRAGETVVARLGRDIVAFDRAAGKFVGGASAKPGEESIGVADGVVFGFIESAAPFAFYGRKLPDMAVTWQAALVDAAIPGQRPRVIPRGSGLVTIEVPSKNELRMGFFDSAGKRIWEKSLRGAKFFGITHPRSACVHVTFIDETKAVLAYRRAVIGEENILLNEGDALELVEIRSGRSEVLRP